MILFGRTDVFEHCCRNIYNAAWDDRLGLFMNKGNVYFMQAKIGLKI
jgi:hypothetical protein